MEVPILKQGSFLIATVQAALSDADFLQFRSALIQYVVRSRSQGVILDVTDLDVMDSFASRTIREIAQMIRLRGAETVIVGIQPEVAFAMVQLGLTMEGVATALDLDEGLEYLNQRSKTSTSTFTS
jgi:rsbT antagonist protein RsbS